MEKPILFEMQLDKCFIFYAPQEKKFVSFLQIVKFFFFGWHHILNISYIENYLWKIAEHNFSYDNC